MTDEPDAKQVAKNLLRLEQFDWPHLSMAVCGKPALRGEGVYLALEWEDGRTSINAVGSYDGGYCCGSAHADIAFCPFCGRKLVSNHADE